MICKPQIAADLRMSLIGDTKSEIGFNYVSFVSAQSLTFKPIGVFISYGCLRGLSDNSSDFRGFVEGCS